MPGFHAIGEAPISALGGDDPADLSDTAAAGATLAALLPTVLTSTAIAGAVPTPMLTAVLVAALQGSDTIEPDVLANLVSSAQAGGLIDLAALLAGDLEARGQAWGTVMTVWELMLADSAEAGDAPEGTATRYAAIADAMVATGLAGSTLVATAACVAAAVLEDLIAAGYSADLVDAGEFLAACDAKAALFGMLTAPALADAAIGNTLRISLIAADSAAATAEPAALLRGNADLVDSGLMYVSVRIGGTDYAGWVLNTDLKAATRHANAPFDSFVTFKGKDYAAGPGGIVMFDDSTSEDGTPISFGLKTFLEDFGSTKFKRAPDVYIAATASGRLVLKVQTRTPQTGVLVEDWYWAERVPAEGPGRGRFKIGRGLKSTWWQFELTAVAGSSFELDQLSFRPLNLDRRI